MDGDLAQLKKVPLSRAWPRLTKSLKRQPNWTRNKRQQVTALFKKLARQDSKPNAQASTAIVVDYSVWVVQTWELVTPAISTGWDQKPYECPPPTPYDAMKIRTGICPLAVERQLKEAPRHLFRSKVPGAWSLETLLKVEDQLRHLVYERAEALWPRLYEELKRCGPMLVSFDWEHVGVYKDLCDFEGLETKALLIKEALSAMNAVRIANSHRWSVTYEDGFKMESLLRDCQTLACALLDESLASEIQNHRMRLKELEILTKRSAQWNMVPAMF